MLVRNGEVVTEAGVFPADVAVEDGIITAVGLGLAGKPEVDASGCYVLPVAIDPHVHVALGQASPMGPICEDLAAATRAALLGGVTTACVYIQRLPIQPVAEVAKAEREKGLETGSVDFAFNAILMPGDPIEEQVPACAKLGISTFKAMLVYRTRGMMVEDDELVRLMLAVKHVGGLVIVHPENGRVTEVLESVERGAGRRGNDSYLRTSPGMLEAEGMFRAAALARVAGCRVLFAHLSAAESVEVLRWLKSQPGGEKIFCETQPHYLLLTNEEVLERGPLAKVGPPLKEAHDIQAVRSALAEGLVNHLCSDHSPRTRTAKLASADILEAPYGGISGIELLLALAHRLTVETPGLLGVEDLVRLVSTNAARLYGLYPKKGVIRPGSDADLVLLPKEGPEVVITPAILHGLSDYSLYERLKSRGFPKLVIRAGQVAAVDGTIVDNPPAKYLARELQ